VAAVAGAALPVYLVPAAQCGRRESGHTLTATISKKNTTEPLGELIPLSAVAMEPAAA
jgi:hypothetical protein